MSARNSFDTSGAARFSSGRGYDNTAGTFKFDPSLPELPALSSSDEKVSLLVRVWSLGTPFALYATGDYQVDWGDGTTTNYTSGTTAEHTIDYDAAGLANTDAPCTFTASTNTVNRTNHGYENGDPVRFFNIVSTTGLISGAAYRVINATANTFQVALKATGSAMSLTNDGSAKLLPYKVALVHVTPQSGSSLTYIALQRKSSELSTSGNLTHQAINIELSMPNATTGNSIIIGGFSISMRHLLRVAIRNIGSCTSFSQLLAYCHQLREFVCTADTSGVTDFTQMALNCNSLQNFPDLDYSSATTLSSAFNQCAQLRTIEGVINSPNCTDFSQAFYATRALQAGLKVDTSGATTIYNMFGQSWISEPPDLDLSSCTNASYAFYASLIKTGAKILNSSNVTDWGRLYQSCTLLEFVPWFDTSGGTNFDYMFNSCYRLRELPLLDYSNATSMYQFAKNAYSLKTYDPNFADISAHSSADITIPFDSVSHIPYIGNTGTSAFRAVFYGLNNFAPLTYPHLESASTDARQVFGNSYIAEIFPSYDFSACTDTYQTFIRCYGVVEIRDMDFSASTNASNLFYQCYSLMRITNCILPSVSFSVAWTSLSAAALNEIYTALPTVTSATITVSNTPGTGSDDPSIATAKGWTVTA